MNIIIIGKMGVGKDTFANILVQKYNYYQTSIAGRLKQIAELLYADVFLNGNRNEKRAILQKLGDLLRSENVNILNEAVIREIKAKNLQKVVVSDVRFTTEYDFFTSYGFIPVRLNVEDNIRFERLFKRDGVYPSIETLNHKSENDICILNNKPLIEIDNNGTIEELEKKADELINFQIFEFKKNLLNKNHNMLTNKNNIESYKLAL